MKSRVIFLDYDDASLARVVDDLMSLRLRYPILTWDIFESSPGNHHVVITLNKALSFAERLDIAFSTSCSEDYLERVERDGFFHRRVSCRAGHNQRPRPKYVRREEWEQYVRIRS